MSEALQTAPWWALSILPLERGTDQHRVRYLLQRGKEHRLEGYGLTHLVEELLVNAEKVSAQRSMDEWVRKAPDLCRHGALSSPRAFVEFCGIVDDTGVTPFLKGFHIRALEYIRQREQALVLLPFAHGKSWLSSLLTPLMDWAENAEFTEARLYYNETYVRIWARRLMQAVENNERLHRLFPHVRRPIKPNPRRGIKGDPCHEYWSMHAFSIGGKQDVSASFEGMTFGAGSTGKRFWRVGCDDWVMSENAHSEVKQDAMWENFHTGPMTMCKPVPFKSDYHTKASTVFVVGTLFDKRDFNSQLMQKWRKQDKPVMRQDIYVTDAKTDVIWPEQRPLAWIEEQRENMGDIAFNMRCRNLIKWQGNEVFRDEDVERAITRGQNWQFGVCPPGARLLIGFDPASGKRTRGAKFPAAVVLGFNGEDVHVVEWGRWSYPQPRQCQKLIEWAKRYVCPVAVEENNIQDAYRHWIGALDEQVRVICHTTTQNKRDWMQGVESLIPLFENDRIHIHAQGAPSGAVNDLRTELVDYPQGRYTDLVMAMWIARHQFELYTKSFIEQRPGGHVPSYARRGHGVVIDMRKLREAQIGAWSAR